MVDKQLLRSRDLIAAICLMAVSLFFLWRTSLLPFFNSRAAGVDSADWYNSAALVPFGIFGALFLLSTGLLIVAIRGGGFEVCRKFSLSSLRTPEAMRIACLATVLICYIGGLVPRVDFIVSSGLVITALIFGFHTEDRKSLVSAVVLTAIPAVYTFVFYTEQTEWSRHWDDDAIALASWIALSVVMFRSAARRHGNSRVTRATPVIAVLVPLLLVTTMAFGFRQNVPNRTGLIFSQIEYHYYVTLRPLFQGE